MLPGRARYLLELNSQAACKSTGSVEQPALQGLPLHVVIAPSPTRCDCAVSILRLVYLVSKRHFPNSAYTKEGPFWARRPVRGGPWWTLVDIANRVDDPP